MHIKPDYTYLIETPRLEYGQSSFQLTLTSEWGWNLPWAFWNGCRTVGQIALKFCSAKRTSFAQLLIKNGRVRSRSYYVIRETTSDRSFCEVIFQQLFLSPSLTRRRTLCFPSTRRWPHMYDLWQCLLNFQTSSGAEPLDDHGDFTFERYLWRKGTLHGIS